MRLPTISLISRLGRAARPAALVVIAGVALGATAPAQTTDPDQARARELVLRIRRSMREIDALLLKGAQPEKIVEEIDANQKRIEELLRETESKSEAVIQSIDELVRLTKYQKGGGGGGGGQPPEQPREGSSGEMPQREKSADPQELSPQPKPSEGQGERPEPQDDPGTPKSGRPDGAPPDQRDAREPPPQGPTGEFERADLSGRWGLLPPKEAEDLQRRNAEEFPQRYRRWMELYFRRVNKLPARER